MEAFLLEGVVAVPQPRYPLSSSIISEPPVTPPTAGSVGSLLGLKPYASISFLRSSSASFCCFLRRQKKRPASTSAAMTTMGITTAMAMVPAGDNPLELLDDCCPLRAELEVDADEDEAVPEVREEPSLATWVGDGVLMTVTTTVEGGMTEPLEVLATMTDVTSCVDTGSEEAVTTEVTGAIVGVGVV